MKKIGVLLYCLLSVVLMASAALAAEGPYFGVQAGATWLDDVEGDGVNIEFDTGYNLGAAAGYDFGQFRAEGEIGYSENGVDQIDISGEGSFGADGQGRALRFMANGYVDFETQTAFTPYLGAGVGVVNIYINNLEVGDQDIIDDDETVFAYQFALGVGYDVVENVVFDCSYRYFATDDVELQDKFGGESEVDIDTHNIVLGFRWLF